MSRTANPEQHAQAPQAAQPSTQEIRRMSFPLNRFLDVAAAILIVFLASLTAGATACLGA